MIKYQIGIDKYDRKELTLHELVNLLFEPYERSARTSIELRQNLEAIFTEYNNINEDHITDYVF